MTVTAGAGHRRWDWLSMRMERLFVVCFITNLNFIEAYIKNQIALKEKFNKQNNEGDSHLIIIFIFQN